MVHSLPADAVRFEGVSIGTAGGRALAALLLAALIAGVAWRAGALTRSGAAAAVVVGAATMVAGWRWGALLIVFFVTSSALSRFRAGEKERRTAGVVAKGGARDAVQVLANGALVAVAALGSVAAPAATPAWQALAAGALATAAADTWATEVGTLAAGAPRSIVSGERVQPGTSGGVTAVGTFAAAAGALFVSAAAFALGWSARLALAAAAGGFVGAMVDSLLGATVQARRWCDRCDEPTERRTHDCGGATRGAGGVPWLDNDGVNLLSGAAGALLALLLAG